MNIYFAGSIRGGRADVGLYHQIVKLLQAYGTVFTEHVGMATVDNGISMTDEQIYHQDTAWISAADLIVAEVTTPSLGVGYELGLAECLHKRIICLFRPREAHRLSAMIAGNPRFKVFTYQSIHEVYTIFQRELGQPTQ